MTDKSFEQTQINTNYLTFDDFLTQYNSQQVEWHMGEVIAKVTNNTRHNAIMGFLFQLLNLFLDINGIGKVILAGVPMYLGDDKPAREPDLMVILNDNLPNLKEKYFAGAVDIAVEIVSPGSVTIDRGAKFIEFEQAGVREYWLIDPLRQEAIFYHLNDEGYYKRLDLNEDGELVSQVLTGFALDPNILWQEQLPEGMAVVKMAQALIK